MVISIEELVFKQGAGPLGVDGARHLLAGSSSCLTCLLQASLAVADVCACSTDWHLLLQAVESGDGTVQRQAERATRAPGHRK